ncbi:CAP domain-containing protein [Streptomyces sp. NPDC094032]|uniref:CAP domain-containing protein n=1 Tax=Streptomyces sp. NPDC094032 TaxID=3155308 RepID=UPI0033300D31
MQHDAYDAGASKARERGGRGRHRKVAGGARRGAPSFRTAMTALGAVAAALAVTTGVYVVSLDTAAGSPPTVAAGWATAARAALPAPREEVPPRAKAAPLAAGTAAQYVDQVLNLANAERRKAGCDPLRSDAKLRTAAQRHADDMSDRDYYAHDSPEGRSPGDRITAAGYTWSTWGENIFRGPHTPAEAVDGWMNSEGHRKNILNCAFQEVGVGVNLTGNGPWWVQDFATP